jgi:predicted  nucleic acid-binding Zn-ribbon protein
VRLRLLSVSLPLVLAFSLLGSAAQVSVPPPPFPGAREGPKDPERARLEREMAKKANHARQEQIQKDTARLLKLATELKEYVDKSNENTLSLDVVKKAEEIEKLAHTVKEKMKDGY